MTYDYRKLIESVNEEKLLAMLKIRKKFKFSIEGVGRKISMKEQLAIIELFKKFPFMDEDVSLNNPENVYKVIENKDDRKVYCGLQIASFKEHEKSG